MKKIICTLICILLLLCGCAPQEDSSSLSAKPVAAKADFTYGVWMSYSEISGMLKAKIGFKEGFLQAVTNMKALGITDLYFHIRSHCDSVIKSEYFPQTELSRYCDFDILEFVIEECHKENIRVHAWINPYRVKAGDSSTDNLPDESPVTKWLGEGKEENVCIYNGVYLNPASRDAKRLVTDGVREILDNYNVDGIHFDDYFYPTADEAFDKQSYAEYKKTAKKPLSLSDWRRANVDELIESCKSAIDLKSRDIVFSISPAASIEKNYSSYYADIGSWIEKGLIDEVIPQLYFGFNHPDPDFCFEALLKEWKELGSNNKRVRLTVGLATYKIGTSSQSDGKEWAENDNIISRQLEILQQDSAVNGAVFFSYSSLFSPAPQNVKEKENLMDILKDE